MRSDTFALGFLLCALPLVFAQAQSAGRVTLSFTGSTAPGCGGGDVRTSAELDWYLDGDRCVDALLGSDNQTLTFKDVAGPGGTDFVTAFGNLEVTVPGDSTALYTVDADFTAPVSEFDLRRPAQIEFTGGSEDRPFLLFSIFPFGGGDGCPRLLRGGSTLTVERVFAAFNEGTAGPRDVSTKLTVTFAPAEGAIFVARLAVPDTAGRPGQGYSYELPPGTVEVAGGFLVVDTETPQSEPQDITLTKRGGVVTAEEGTEFVGAKAEGSELQHAVSVDFDSLVLCLPTVVEFPAPANGRLVFNDVDIQYGGRESCVMTPTGTTLEVAPGATQVFGKRGHGIQQWRDGSTLLVEEGADVTFEGTLSIPDGEEGGLDIRYGAKVRVANAAQALETSPGQIRVRVAEGATFDLSEASPQVKSLFVVERLEDPARGLDVGAYELAQNPVRDGEAVLRAKPGAPRLTRIELLDTAGRVVSGLAPTAARSEYLIPVPKAGVHALRLVDAEGRVGTLRVHGGN